MDPAADMVKTIQNLWKEVEARITDREDLTGTRHITLRITAQFQGLARYLYFYDHSTSDGEAVSVTTAQWQLLRDGILHEEVNLRSRSDGDYSPSEPCAKNRRTEGLKISYPLC